MTDRTKTISICCITAGPLDRVAAILSRYRPYVDEIVCAVHAGFDRHEVEGLRGVVDLLLPCEMGADFLQETYRPWLYGRCSGDWIVSTDSDEVPSLAFLRTLRSLADANDVVTYVTACRWLYPDAAHYLDEYPWEPAWKVVMVRNDPATLYLKTGVHEGPVLVRPLRYLDLVVYHLDCVVNPYAVRKAKALFYDNLDGVQIMEDGRPISHTYYLPEEASKFPVAEVAREDRDDLMRIASTSIGRILDRSAEQLPLDRWLPGAISYSELLREAGTTLLGAEAYRANLELRRRSRTPNRNMSVFQVGEQRSLLTTIRNDSNAVWLRDGRNDVWLASRWFPYEAAGVAQIEGPRTPFSADLRPGGECIAEVIIVAPSIAGRYELRVDLVHEGVRWFDCGVGFTVEVVA